MANTHKLTLQKVIQLHSALSQLDGHAETTYDDKGQPQRGKITPYQFGAKLRYAIIRNLAILGRRVEAFDKARNEALTRISGGSGVVEQTDPEYTKKVAALQAELNQLLENEEEVIGLFNLSLEAFDLDKNPNLPNATLAVLEPLLVD